MIIKAPGNARAHARSRVERGVQLDPLAIDLFLDVELEFDLEDAFLIDELRGFQEGAVQFLRLPLRRGADLGHYPAVFRFEDADLAVAGGDRDVVLVADLLDGP